MGVTTDADQDGYASDIDCDDGDASIHPGADETCDGVDDNCDGQVDDNPIDPSTCYVDQDGDGYGTNDEPTVQGCEAPEGYAGEGGDCNDANNTINPGATDIPGDTLDEDCNGHDTVTFTVDADHDGYGTEDGTVALADDGTCDPSQGESDHAWDCNDDDADIHPGATEIPGNGTDESCDGHDTPPCYTNADGDGDPSSVVLVDPSDGDNSSPTGDQDCDDTLTRVHPGAEKVCDGLDDNCNDSLDDQDGLVCLEEAGDVWTDLTADFVDATQHATYTASNGTNGHIWLGKGTSYRTLDISTGHGDDLTVAGRYGKDLTTLSGLDPTDLQAGGQDRLIHHSGNGAFTLTGLTTGGGGMWVNNGAADVTLTGSHVDGNHAVDGNGDGGGILMENGTVALVGSTARKAPWRCSTT